MKTEEFDGEKKRIRRALSHVMDDCKSGSQAGGNVTISMVADTVHLEPKSMSKYVREWGKPVVEASGRRPAEFKLRTILPKLKQQFPRQSETDWSKLAAATKSP